MQPKRILHVTSVLNFGGIETLIMNIFRKIDREKVIFDFLVVREDKGFFEDEILSLGGKIYKIPSLKKSGYFSFKHHLNNFFAEHGEYKTVHCHLNALSGIVLEVAQANGVERRIAHAHTAFPKYSFLEGTIKNYFKKSIKKYATDFLACSKDASDWLYGKDFSSTLILKNGIDAERFTFSKTAREKIRKELKLEDKFVIINVGRFSKEKNHDFLVEVFEEVLKINPDSVLICIGNGKLKDRLRKKIKSLKLNQVYFFDSTPDVYNFLSASDVYVSTSAFEGFGNSASEAQFNSLPCILSDGFSKDVNFTKNCKFLSLKDSTEKWAEVISMSNRQSVHFVSSQDFEDFHILSTVKALCRLYFKK